MKDEIPFLAKKLQAAPQQFQQWFNDSIGNVFGRDANWLQDSISKTGSNISSVISSTLKGLSSSLFALFIIPVFQRFSFITGNNLHSS